MGIAETTPAELTRERDMRVDEAREATARVYDLVDPHWYRAFVDFPVVAGEISHAWTCFWPSHAPGSRARAMITIATGTSSASHRLHSRMGLRFPIRGDVSDHALRVAGRSFRGVLAFVEVEPGLLAASFDDAGAVVVVTARKSAALPRTVAIHEPPTLDALIAGWRSL